MAAASYPRFLIQRAQDLFHVGCEVFVEAQAELKAEVLEAIRLGFDPGPQCFEGVVLLSDGLQMVSDHGYAVFGGEIREEKESHQKRTLTRLDTIMSREVLGSGSAGFFCIA